MHPEGVLRLAMSLEPMGSSRAFPSVAAGISGTKHSTFLRRSSTVSRQVHSESRVDMLLPELFLMFCPPALWRTFKYWTKVETSPFSPLAFQHTPRGFPDRLLCISITSLLA